MRSRLEFGIFRKPFWVLQRSWHFFFLFVFAFLVVSASVFANHTAYMSSCVRPSGLEAFNTQLVWFAPKGIQDEDKHVVYREPHQLRTIFRSNKDSKIVSRALSYKLTPPTLQVTSHIQRGFCRGRQLSLNLVDLDA